MRKILAIIGLTLICNTYVFAAFGASTAWDVRTTGADTNGGAYDSAVVAPGTDESQGAGTAITITLTGTTTGTGSPVFSSTTHGPGNFVHIASGSGCTTGWYEVLSQSGGTATFDHAMGVSTNVCVGVIGGSLLTFATPEALMVSGNTMWVQNGTYTITSSISGSSVTIQTHAGYTSTHGDIAGKNCSQATCTILTTATNSVPLYVVNNTGPNVWRNISMSNSAGTRSTGFRAGSAAKLVIDGSKSSGLTKWVEGDNLVANTFSRVEVRNSECTSGQNGPAGACVTTANSTAQVYLIDDNFHDNQGITVITGCDTFIYRTTIVGTTPHTTGTTGTGYNSQGTSGCTVSIIESVIANNVLDNILFGNVNTLFVMESSVTYGAGQYGIDTGAGTADPAYFQISNVGFGSNAGGNFDSPTKMTTGINPITITANPWTNSASNDYSLNSTAGGGTALKAAGIPGLMPGGTTTGYGDVNVVQSQAGAGGSGGGSYEVVQ